MAEQEQWREGIEWYRIALMRHFRRSRMRQFGQLFPLSEETRVLDIGGTRYNWTFLETRPRITMVNLDSEVGTFGNIEMRYGDATALAFPDGSFDLVYSNSVIEHVGDWNKMAAYATSVQRLAARYYVQTPNRWFPVETHSMGVLYHWLPLRLACKAYRWMSLQGWRLRPDQRTVADDLYSFRLLSRRELKRLFPDATIIAERTWLFPFVPKSFIVVRGASAPSTVPRPTTKPSAVAPPLAAH